MKQIISLIAVVAVPFSALAEDAPVYFRGLLDFGDEQQFSLATDGGAHAAWVSVGDTFQDYEVVAYDADSSELVLEKDDEEVRLRLAGSAVAPGEAGPALEEAAELMESLKFDEMMATSIEQQKDMMEDMMRQMTAQSGMEVSDEMLAEQRRAMDAFNDAMDWEGFKEDMIQAYGATFTRSELRGLIDFYSTPAGQGFVEKQGDLMRRTQELMQPRIIEAMTQMQSSMMEGPPPQESVTDGPRPQE